MGNNEKKSPPKLERERAESELKSLRFLPCEVDPQRRGQWWRPPSGGPKFFLMWEENGRTVDEGHLRAILLDYERYREFNGGSR